MCLFLHSASIPETAKLKAKKKPIRAYKLLRGYGEALLSPYRYTEWIPGETKTSSRKHYRKPMQPNSAEILRHEINQGLHFYTTRKEARIAKKHFHQNSIWGENLEIWIVEIQPRDVVSTGFFQHIPSLVAHRAKLVKRIY